MTPKRPQRLNWVGNELPDGRPERYLEFIPARNLTAEETDALTSEQLTIVRHHPDLYHEVHAPAAKPKPAAKRKKASTPELTATAEVVGAMPDDDTAATPASESEV